MNQRKPAPLDPPPARKSCPVCGEVSYSRAGIHPQCAQELADSRRQARQKTAKKPKKKVPKKSGTKAWHKPCPKCGTQVHIRKSVCECGYAFRR